MSERLTLEATESALELQDRIKKQEELEKEEITPEATPQPIKSISERIAEFLDNIATPKGT